MDDGGGLGAAPGSRGSRNRPRLSSINGVLPAGGSGIPTFLSYAVEKRLSKHPEEFGNGAINEGVTEARRQRQQKCRRCGHIGAAVDA